VVGIAATQDLVAAVPAVDAALRERLVTSDGLDAALPFAGRAQAKATAAIGMGSALSGSPAESVFRVRLRQLRAPEPLQQHEFRRAGERRAVVDFWFPEQGVVVEVDGRAKYEDPAMLGGRTTAEAHWHEKQREDFVRSFAAVRTVVRITWADLMDLDAVRRKLLRAGLPVR
jgi:very-short-patch-repair endonuclease